MDLIEFDSEKHEYKVNGVVYPSVTTILSILSKPFIAPWASKLSAESMKGFIKTCLHGGNIPTDIDITKAMLCAKRKFRDVSKEATDIGTNVHKLCEEGLTGNEILIEVTEVKNGYNAFNKFIEDTGFEILEREVVLSHPCGFAGTVDCIGRLNGKLIIVDYKTSKYIYPEYKMQLAAYKEMYENSCKKVDGVGVLRLDKLTGEYEFESTFDSWTDDEIRLAWLRFKCLFDYYILSN